MVIFLVGVSVFAGIGGGVFGVRHDKVFERPQRNYREQRTRQDHGQQTTPKRGHVGIIACAAQRHN